MQLIVANWKMYLGLRESVALAKKVSGYRLQVTGVEIVLCPSFVALEEVAKVVKRARIKLGAQDVEPERRGAFTGEVGLDDLAELGVKYVLAGHSERRRILHETDEMINQKVRAALKVGMRPILCVGEPFRPSRQESGSVGQRAVRAAQAYVAKQLRADLKGVTRTMMKKLVIAYEPVWAIGTGRPDTPKDAAAMHRYISDTLPMKKIPILYGGSVNADNARAFLRTPGVDGLLIGGASTKAAEFLRIIRSA